jgi:hypothetical protein
LIRSTSSRPRAPHSSNIPLVHSLACQPALSAPPPLSPSFLRVHSFRHQGAQKAVSADERARILGEEPAVRIITPAFIPPPPRPPPADYVPGRPIQVNWQSSAKPMHSSPLILDSQPQPPPGMSAESAMQPGVFRPFSKTPLKEARYLQFLDGKPVEFPPHMDAADQRDEFDEFLQAARLYVLQQPAGQPSNKPKKKKKKEQR